MVAHGRPECSTIIYSTGCADEKGDEKMLAKLESWVEGGSSAAPHLQLLCFLLQSSLAAQRQLLEDTCLAERYMCTPAGSALTQLTLLKDDSRNIHLPCSHSYLLLQLWWLH